MSLHRRKSAQKRLAFLYVVVGLFLTGYEVLLFLQFFVLLLDSSPYCYNKDVDDSQAMGIPHEIPLVSL